ncbi:N-acetylmuramoyl-L-alanine amidase [bacterium]|nr:N-acetylmuramoyl-L-alanine amidase [bacterium]
MHAPTPNIHHTTRSRLILSVILLTLLLVSALYPVDAIAQAADDHWTIHLPQNQQATAPVRIVGATAYVDALSFADAIGVDYHRDDLGRYVFSFPGALAIFAPEAAFARLDGMTYQLPASPFKTDSRLFIPEATWVDYVNRFTPGLIALHRSPRALSFTPPESDILEIEADPITAKTDSSHIRLLLTRPQRASLALIDSTHLAVRLPEANPGDFSYAPEENKPGYSWDAEQSRLIIELPRGLYAARFSGPTDDCRYTLTLSFVEEENGTQWDVKTALEADKRKWTLDTVVIDAGHGGKDPGAIGHSGIYEKDLALETALAVREVMRKRLPGIKVVMTRDDDTFIPLYERTRIANRANGKLFVSIHFNSARDRRAHGLETYFLAPARTERAMEIAKVENEVIQYEEQLHDYPDLGDEAFILLSMAQAQFGKESEDLASMVLDGMQDRTGQKSRGVDQAGFYVLMGASMPAILVEGGFLSNANEERLVRSKEYQAKVAESIVDAIEEFVRNHENDS